MATDISDRHQARGEDHLSTTGSTPICLACCSRGGLREGLRRGSKAADRNPCSARNFHFGGKALAKLSKNDLCVDWLKRSVAISCLNGPAVILRNEGGTGNHWLVVNRLAP